MTKKPGKRNPVVVDPNDPVWEQLRELPFETLLKITGGLRTESGRENEQEKGEKRKKRKPALNSKRES